MKTFLSGERSIQHRRRGLEAAWGKKGVPKSRRGLGKMLFALHWTVKGEASIKKALPVWKVCEARESSKNRRRNFDGDFHREVPVLASERSQKKGTRLEDSRNTYKGIQINPFLNPGLKGKGSYLKDALRRREARPHGLEGATFWTGGGGS